MRERGTHLAVSNFEEGMEASPPPVGNPNERGMALVAVLLIMSLLLMLGLAVTFTSLSDKAITQNFKNLTSGFYAAEAGVNNLHRLLRNDKFVTGSLPEPPHVTPRQSLLDQNASTIDAAHAMNHK